MPFRSLSSLTFGLSSGINLKRGERVAVIAVAASLWLGWAWPPSQACGQSVIGKEQQRAVQASLVGEWVTDVGKTKVRLKMTEDGRFALDSMKGKYVVEGNVLKLHSEETEVGYQFVLTANELDLSGGDLAQPLKFARIREPGSYFKQLFTAPRKSSREKLYRVFVILAVSLVCRLVISLLRAMAWVVIHSEWGPFKFLYRHRKNRAMTMHSLVLNLAKYVIYFTALGFVLTELGINYTAYLASLSVIGLAIAFGAQGLVQDMVTGFFVIFEGQFDVGDMVEIPPQTGIVEELGLRMTRLRNYLGQRVVIPNRNIAAVGNYAKGAQEAYVDVAVTNREAAEQAINTLRQLGEEIGRQFKGAILAVPKVLGPMSLATDEHFVRLHVSIWPQQQWVIEDQLLPRIREVLKRKGFEVPGDRIAIFYHAREEYRAPTLRRALKKVKRRPYEVTGESE